MPYRGSGGSLEPPGPLPTHLHTVYVAYSECLPARLNPLAKRICCFSQVGYVSLMPGAWGRLADKSGQLPP
jgi:hypothetical protein